MSAAFTDPSGRHFTAADAAMRDEVIDALHYTTGTLSDPEHRYVRKFADGFGRSCPADAFWDWSHVRDSSPEAIRLMHAQLCRVRDGSAFLPSDGKTQRAFKAAGVRL